MSLTFSQYKQENPTAAGYCRIGHIVLTTPPVDILTGRVVNNERLTTLRGRNDMVKKTGQARWDVTIRWIALRDDAAGDPYQQWDDLLSILAMFHVAPFVEVENGYIRQALAEQDSTLSSARIGFALRQLRVSTHNDIVDGLDIALTMTLFNYFPYSTDFGYVGDKGQPVDAWQSTAFSTFIENWKQENLYSTVDGTYDGTPLLNWKDQIQGTTKLRWRQYSTVKIGQAVATEVTAAAVAALASSTSSSVPKSTAAISGAGQYDALINRFAKQYDVSPAMLKAVMGHESAFLPSAVGANYKNNVTTAGTTINEVTKNLQTRIKTDADGGFAYVQQYVAQNGTPPDLGLMQINWKTAQALNPNLRPVDLFVPETNIALGAQYLSQLYTQGMTDSTVYWYNTGPDKSGRKHNDREQTYTDDVLNRFRQYSVGSTTTEVAVAQPAPSPIAPTPAASATSSGKAPGDVLTPAQKQEILQMVGDGWSYDHAVNDVAFFYKEQQMTLTDSNHGDIANAYGLYPQQFTILFVNNLAQIPLAGYQYPTYQHIGSTSSKISIVMSSVGQRDSDDQEPLHPGISTLSSASEFLEAQYLQYRNSWRSVRSVHRMQAFYVENQILNMLGVRGITIDGITTSTLPNMADTQQVEVSGMQYENIFEVSSPFRINAIDSAYATTAQNIVNSGVLQSLSPNESTQINVLSQFAKGRASSDVPILLDFLAGLGKNANADFSPYASLVNAKSPADTTVILWKPFSSSDRGLPSIQARLKQCVTTGIVTYGDCFLVRAAAQLLDPHGQDYDLTQASNYAEGLSDVIGHLQVIQSVYDATFKILASYNANFAADVNTLANSPKFSSQFSSVLSPSGPGLDQGNADHGAYRDMGLPQVSLNGTDVNPGYYFYDHGADYQTDVRKSLDQTVAAATGNSALVNRQQQPDSYDIVITESLYVGKNADTNSLMKMTNIPGYNMAEAFPTFKLFLMEDSSPGVVHAFDNFYSYASVLDIEVIRFTDKPDLARIQITNLANLLQHKLFDNTLQGKYERSLEPFFSELAPSEGPITGGDATAGIVAGKTASNQIYQLQKASVSAQVTQLLGYDMRDGVMPNSPPQRVPLQYAVLQPGTKIQVRLGYANNPDLLVPVFTGRVTTIDGTEVLTIEAESYMAELFDIPIKDDKPLSNEKYGGKWPWHDAGDVTSVVELMLKTDAAKHFGAFQLSASSPLIQGLTWQNRVGKMIGEFSVNPANEIVRVGAAMASSYDRSGENVLINHLISHTGTAVQNRGIRTFFDSILGTNSASGSARSLSDESSTWGYYQFDYKIPDNSTKTTWDYIRDITRRYPEYQVLVKQYGFPYSADATLVVAHPLDWYFARLPMIGDSERYRAGREADAEFQIWWKVEGKHAWDVMLQQVKADQSLTFISVADPKNPTEFYAALQNIARSTEQFFGGSLIHSNQDSTKLGATLEYLDQLLGRTLQAVDAPAAMSMAKAAANEVFAVERMWEKYVQLQNPQASDRLKPVGRFHFIDHQTIVNNSMRLNNKIYNTIRIGSKTTPINANIPSHHRRILDVTDLLIDSKDNVEHTDHLVRAVMQSFMKEEVGKMYEGEIVLRGVPEIEPGDSLVLLDPSTAIVGIVKVDKVIQSFNQETGYTTIVYPRAATAVNESASASVGRMMTMIMAQSGSKIWANVGSMAHLAAHSNTSTLVGAGLGAAAVGATGAAAVSLIGSPPGWVIASLVGMAVMGGMLYAADQSEKGNMIEVMPVTRWGRPWIGGLEGYAITDFAMNIQNSFQAFKADNVYPLIDTYRYFKGAPSNTLPVQPSR